MLAAVACAVTLSSHTAVYDRSSLPALSTMHRCPSGDLVVNDVNGVPVTTDSVVTGVGLGTPVEISGWAIDSRTRSRAGGVVALIDGRVPVEAAYGEATPEIATILRRRRYAAARYDVTVKTSNLSLGLHRFSFSVIGHDRKKYCRAAHVVDVLIVPPGEPRPLVIGFRHHIVGSLDQVTTVDKAFAYGPEVNPVWLERSAMLFLRGWAVDVADRREIKRYEASIDGRKESVHPGDLRPELAQTFPSLSKLVASYAGFTAVIPLTRFPTGVHTLTLTAIDPGTGTKAPLVRNFGFATYSPSRLPKLVEPSRGLRRRVQLADGHGVTGSIDVITTLGSPDSISQTLPVYVRPQDFLFIEGWALDVPRREDLPATYALLDGRREFAVHLGEQRPDLARTFPTLPAAVCMRSGFSVAIPLHGLAAGLHTIRLETIGVGPHVNQTIARLPFTVL